MKSYSGPSLVDLVLLFISIQFVNYKSARIVNKILMLLQFLKYRRWYDKYLLYDKVSKNYAFGLVGFVSSREIQRTHTHDFKNFRHIGGI